MKYVSHLVTVLLSVLIISSCGITPMTQRKQLNIIPEKMLVKESEKSYRQILKRNRLSNDLSQLEVVNNVSNQVIKAAEIYLKETNNSKRLKHFKWEVSLIESDQVNAFVMPGGKIVVYTGILPIAENEDGLAAIIGHEVGHALARHSNERVSQILVAQLGSIGLDIFLQAKKVSYQVRQSIQQVFGIGATLGVLLPYSRKHETEADEIGLYLSAIAGYDPHEAPKVWERMEKKYGYSGMAFLQSHPSHKKRKELLEEKIAMAEQYAQKYGKKDDIGPIAAVGSGNKLPENKVSSSSQTTTPEVIAGTTLLPKTKYKNPKKIISTQPGEVSISYKIQLLATSKIDWRNESVKAVQQHGVLEKEYVPKSNTERLILGEFSTFSEASEVLEQLNQVEFRDAFIVLYKNGYRKRGIY